MDDQEGFHFLMDHRPVEDGETKIYLDKYLDIYQLWKKQEQYIDKKLEEIQYKDSYTQFLMEEYRCQAEDIIKLNQAVRELSLTIHSLRDELAQLKRDSKENQKRCDYLDRQCSSLRQKNKMLTDMLRERGELHESVLESTFTLDDSRDPVEGLSQRSPIRTDADLRTKSRMSSDFHDTDLDTLAFKFIPLPQGEKTGIQQDFPSLFDVEIFDADGTSAILSYEDSDADDSDHVAVEEFSHQRDWPRKSSSRLSWLTSRFRSNKVKPCEAL